MSLLVAGSPLLAVALAVFALRRPPVQAAGIGAAMATGIFMLMSAGDSGATIGVVAGTLVLSANAAAVILPGLLFVEVTQRQGASAALGRWVQGIPAAPGLKIVLLVVGLAPFVESLTGFGVSLVAILPAALALLPREAGLRAALLGMNVMPWGTLGLATIVGSQLAAIPTGVLGQSTALTSSLIFPTAGLLAALTAGERRPAGMALAIGLGGLFSLVLWAVNGVLGAEIAGVLAGAVTLATIAGGLLLLGRRPGLPEVTAWPYLGLFGLVLMLRVVLTAFPELEAIRVTAGDTSWAPLTSPGLPLLLAALMAAQGSGLAGDVRAALGGAVKPLAAVVLFLLMSQAMVQGGMVGTLAGTLQGLDAGVGLGLVAAFGIISGYMTGSNIGGNALLMKPAAALGDQHGAELLFAAVQNSAAGHGVLASVPIVALLASLAGADAKEQGRLMRFGLAVAVLNGVLIVLAARLWSSLGAI